jgi:hypothetical protein
MERKGLRAAAARLSPRLLTSNFRANEVNVRHQSATIDCLTNTNKFLALSSLPWTVSHVC